MSGAYVVTVRPVLAFREFERAFPIAWDALEYADLLGGELGCGVLDRSGVAL